MSEQLDELMTKINQQLAIDLGRICTTEGKKPIAALIEMYTAARITALEQQVAALTAARDAALAEAAGLRGVVCKAEEWHEARLKYWAAMGLAGEGSAALAFNDKQREFTELLAARRAGGAW